MLQSTVVFRGQTAGGGGAAPDELQRHASGFEVPEARVKKATFERFLEGNEGVKGKTVVDHFEVYQSVRGALEEAGYHVVGVVHAIGDREARYGCLITFLPRTPADDGEISSRYVTACLLRHSYDGSYPLSMHVGAHLCRKEVLWLSRTEAGKRRHTKHFAEDYSREVNAMVVRLESIIEELRDRFSTYFRTWIEKTRDIHDLIFQAYDRGIITKTQMPAARDNLLKERGEGPWRLFVVMQYLLSPRRGKNLFKYQRLSRRLEDLLDQWAGFE